MSTKESKVERQITKLLNYFTRYGKDRFLLYSKVDKALGIGKCPSKEKRQARKGFQEERRQHIGHINKRCEKNGLYARFHPMGNGKGLKLYIGHKEIALIESTRVTKYGTERSKVNTEHLKGVLTLPENAADTKIKALMDAMIREEKAEISSRETLDTLISMVLPSPEDILLSIQKQLPAPKKSKGLIK